MGLIEVPFNKILTNYTWSLEGLSEIFIYLDFAIANNYLVEITVIDG